MVKTIIVLLFALAFIPANARGFEIETKWRCGDTTTMRDELSRRGEQIIGTGAIQNTTEAKFLMSLWVSPKTGNWTILATFLERNEITCVVGFGTAFNPNINRPVI